MHVRALQCRLNAFFLDARALLAMSVEPSEAEADYAAEEDPHDADDDEDGDDNYTSKYEEEKRNLSEVTSPFPKNMQYQFSTDAWKHICLDAMLSDDRWE